MGREIGWTDFTTPTAVFLSFLKVPLLSPWLWRKLMICFQSVEYDKSDTLIKSVENIYIKDIYLYI